MVERPIKKADRQPNSEAKDSAPSPQRFDDSDKKRSTGGGNSGGGNSGGGSRDKRDKRGGSRDEETKQPVNLALVRGPKPTKPQPIVEEVISEEPEVNEETTPEETVEA
jgi:hypothetical protein